LALRLLIFHGYLLHGTGSNIYNTELAQWRLAGLPEMLPALTGAQILVALAGADARGSLVDLVGWIGWSTLTRPFGISGLTIHRDHRSLHRWVPGWPAPAAERAERSWRYLDVLYLAGSESAMGAFANEVSPAATAETLRQAR
jgi:hypothetical protein